MTRLEKIDLALEKKIQYNHLTGVVKGVKGNEIKKKCNGYISIALWDGKKNNYLYAHQFAYFIIYGKTPDCIDHINKDKTDNRIVNLREVTKQVNALNTSAKGVSFDKSGKKWVAKIQLNNKSHIIGRFELKEDAEKNYKDYKELIIKNKII